MFDETDGCTTRQPLHDAILGKNPSNGDNTLTPIIAKSDIYQPMLQIDVHQFIKNNENREQDFELTVEMYYFLYMGRKNRRKKTSNNLLLLIVLKMFSCVPILVVL